MRTILLVCVLGAGLSAQTTASIPNFSGKWALQGSGVGRGAAGTPAGGAATAGAAPAGGHVGGAGGGGRGFAQILTLNQVGAEVTGEFAGGGNASSASPVNNEIYAGKVENGTLTFYVWRGSDKPAKTTYEGKLSATGDEITFAVTGGPARGGGPAAGPQTVVAKRAQ